GSPELVAFTDGTTVTSIALDTDNVYWTTTCCLTCSGCTSQRAPKTGGTAVDVYPEAGFRIAVDDTTAFLSSGGFFSVPKLGGAATQIADSYGHALAIDDTTVFFSDDLTLSILSVPKTGGSATPLGAGTAEDIVVDDTDVYWVMAATPPAAPAF